MWRLSFSFFRGTTGHGPHGPLLGRLGASQHTAPSTAALRPSANFLQERRRVRPLQAATIYVFSSSSLTLPPSSSTVHPAPPSAPPPPTSCLARQCVSGQGGGQDIAADGARQWAVGPGGQPAGGLADAGQHARRCTSSFSDDKFWAYLMLIQIFSELLGRINNYCKGCICHKTSVCKEFDMQGDKHSCPMRGRRVPEIAAGDLHRYVTTLCELDLARLIQQTAPFNAEARQGVTRNFESCKRFLLAELQLRLTWFDTLPLKALTIGHHDEAKARAGLLISCAMYDRDVGRPGVQVHRFSERLFGHGAASLRAAVFDVITGAPFEDHPELLLLRAKARFASNIEIGIERDHAQLHRHILLASHHTEAYASLAMRKGEILDSFDENPERARTFAGILSDVRSPGTCLSALGLAAHPVVSDSSSVSRDGKLVVPQHIACRVIYRGDLQTQFSTLPHMWGPGPLPPMPGPGSPGPDPPDDGDGGHGPAVG